jgi:MFS family permease
MVFLFLGGSAMDYWQSRGVSSRLTRGVFAAGLVALSGCFLPLMLTSIAPAIKLNLLIVGTAIGAPIFVAVPMVVSEIVPQRQRAVMLAIANATVTISGVFAPALMGWMVGGAAATQAGYHRGFALLGVVLIIGGLIGAVFVRPALDRERLARHARAR